MIFTAINHSYDLYQNRFELRDRFIESVLDTSVNAICTAESIAIEVYGWASTEALEDAWVIAVKIISWAIASYVWLVVSYGEQVIGCWEAYCEETIELTSMPSVDELNVSTVDGWHYPYRAIASMAWADVQRLVDRLPGLSNDVSYGDRIG